MPFLSTAWLTGYLATVSLRRILGRFSLNAAEFGRSSHLPGIQNPPPKTNKIHSNKIAAAKPPNILVYTGDGMQQRKNFEPIKDELSRILNRNSYVIYRLDDDQIFRHPWSKNSVLLIIHTNKSIDKLILRRFKQYLDNGGGVLSVGRGNHKNASGLLDAVAVKPFNLKPGENCTAGIRADRLDVKKDQMNIYCEPFFFEDENESLEVLASEKESGQPVIVYSCKKESKAVLSLVDLFIPDQDNTKRQILHAILKKLNMKCVSQEMPCLTAAYLFGSEQNIQLLMDTLHPHLSDGICKGKQFSLLFCNKKMTPEIPLATEDLLPIIMGHAKECPFDYETYKQHLHTNILGQVLIYTDVIPSTQTLLEGSFTFVQNIPEEVGVIAVTRQQVKGKGRSGNAWLSPIGCMMFSMVVRVEFGTELGVRLPYVQHIASLALVEAVRGLAGYEDINICLKWPNDIYYGRTVKIGGVVVSSTVCGNSFSAVVGMGVNVSNEEPTICINDIIKLYNEEHGTSLAELPLPMLLARTVTCLENMITDFQKNGKEGFLRKYYQHWLHSGSKVTLDTGLHPQKVTIIGLDDFGFLLVQKESGENLSVQPDGNTFDLLANLIEIK